MKIKNYLGYGVATFADAGPYSFATTYLILFLTTVAALSPDSAGTVSSAIILISGLGEAIVGYISDHTTSKYGRRRPFLILAILPLGIGLVMLFHVFGGSESFRTVMYIIAGGLFWAGYGIYYTPYSALGAELTNDYDERSTLRSYARIFGIIGNVCGMVLPLMVVSFLTSRNISEEASWQIMAALVAVVACFSIFVTWNSTRGREIVTSTEKKDRPGLLNIIKEYFGIIRLKPFKYLIFVIFFFMAANTFYSSSMVFFARYKLGMKDEVTSTVFLISMVVNIILTPLFAWFAVKFGKKKVMVYSMSISGLGCVLLKVIGIETYMSMICFVCVFSIAYACFWQLFNSALYDVSEVGEYITGKRMEGSILSVSSIIMAISMSIATKVLGLVLSLSGYEAEAQVQSQAALDMISNMFILIPGLCLVAAGIFMIAYPLDKKHFDLLKVALEKEKRGEEVDKENLKRII